MQLVHLFLDARRHHRMKFAVNFLIFIHVPIYFSVQQNLHEQTKNPAVSVIYVFYTYLLDPELKKYSANYEWGVAGIHDSRVLVGISKKNLSCFCRLRRSQFIISALFSI